MSRSSQDLRRSLLTGSLARNPSRRPSVTRASAGPPLAVLSAAASSGTSRTQILLNHPALIESSSSRARRIEQSHSIHRQFREGRSHTSRSPRPVERPTKPLGNRCFAVLQRILRKLFKVKFASVLFENAKRFSQ